MTYNIKVDIPFPDKKIEWSSRKDKVIKVIERNNPDFLGLQEVTKKQLTDLKVSLSQYRFFGKVRSSEDNSEYSPIGFKENKYELLKSDTFWLSDTPEVMSKTEDWQAGCFRVVTWGIFKEKGSDKKFMYLNTHFDHISEYPRYKAAQVVNEFIQNNDLPLVMTGDFNGEPYERFYHELTKSLEDVVLHSPHHIGPMKTCSMLEVGDPFLCEKSARIDYVFASHEFETFRTEVCTDSFQEFVPSDHYPVVAKLKL